MSAIEVGKTEIIHVEDEQIQQTKSNEYFDKTTESPDLEIPASLANLTPEELEALDKKTTFKVDLRIFPMVVLIYILNYLDRSNIASARLGGLEDDLKLHGDQYQTCISILFVGYILMQIPSNMLLNKIGKPSLYITVIMTLWGSISACTGAVQSYAGLLVVRLLLGFVEAGFFGSCLYYLSCWYTRKELSFRNAVLYSGSLFSGALGGLIAVGIIDRMDHVRNMRSWRWLFIIEGSITVAVVPFAYFILPDMPHNTKFLNQQEKDLIMWKLRKEVGQDDFNEEHKENYLQTFWLCIKDIKVWSITGILSLLVAACGVTNFFPTVVQTLKFDRITTLGLTVPPYILAVIFTYLWAMHADKTQERTWHIVIPMLFSIVAFIIAVSTMNTGARYFSMCLMIPSLYCSFTTILTWMSNSVPRPPLKRAIALSLMNCLSNTTSIWNAYLYPSSDGPRYTKAFICNIVFLACAIAITFILRIRLAVLNRRIEDGSMNWESELGKGNDGSDVNPDFRFLL